MSNFSVNSLVGSAPVSYKNLMKNVSNGYNMGEIVFEKGKKEGTGSFTRINNHAGCLAFLNNVVKTEDQNRITNAAVFKALFEKYGAVENEDGAVLDANNDAAILGQEFDKKFKDWELETLFKGRNPYLREAFKFLLCGDNTAPLSRDELRLLDALLADAQKDENSVKKNMEMLDDLKAMKSGREEIKFGNASKGNQAEFWISSLNVKGLSEKEFLRVTTETVNQRYAKELNAYKGLAIPADRNKNRPYMEFFALMPGVVNTINENILNARKWGAGKKMSVTEVEAFLSKVFADVEAKFNSAYEAHTRIRGGKKECDFKAPPDALRKCMIEYMKDTLFHQYPDMKSILENSENKEVFEAVEKAYEAKTKARIKPHLAQYFEEKGKVDFITAILGKKGDVSTTLEFPEAMKKDLRYISWQELFELQPSSASGQILQKINKLDGGMMRTMLDNKNFNSGMMLHLVKAAFNEVAKKLSDNLPEVGVFNDEVRKLLVKLLRDYGLSNAETIDEINQGLETYRKDPKNKGNQEEIKINDNPQSDNLNSINEEHKADYEVFQGFAKKNKVLEKYVALFNDDTFENSKSFEGILGKIEEIDSNLSRQFKAITNDDVHENPALFLRIVRTCLVESVKGVENIEQIDSDKLFREKVASIATDKLDSINISTEDEFDAKLQQLQQKGKGGQLNNEQNAGNNINNDNNIINIGNNKNINNIPGSKEGNQEENEINDNQQSGNNENMEMKEKPFGFQESNDNNIPKKEVIKEGNKEENKEEIKIDGNNGDNNKNINNIPGSKEDDQEEIKINDNQQSGNLNSINEEYKADYEVFQGFAEKNDYLTKYLKLFDDNAFGNPLSYDGILKTIKETNKDLGVRVDAYCKRHSENPKLVLKILRTCLVGAKNIENCKTDDEFYEKFSWGLEFGVDGVDLSDVTTAEEVDNKFKEVKLQRNNEQNAGNNINNINNINNNDNNIINANEKEEGEIKLDGNDDIKFDNINDNNIINISDNNVNNNIVINNVGVNENKEIKPIAAEEIKPMATQMNLVLACLGGFGPLDVRSLETAWSKYEQCQNEYISKSGRGAGLNRDELNALNLELMRQALQTCSNESLRLAYQKLTSKEMSDADDLPVRLRSPLMDLEGLIVSEAIRRDEEGVRLGPTDVSPQSLKLMLNTSARSSIRMENNQIAPSGNLTPTELKRFGDRVRRHELTINTRTQYIFGDLTRRDGFKNAPVKKETQLVNMFMLEEKGIKQHPAYVDMRKNVEDTYFPQMKNKYKGTDRPFYAAINTCDKLEGACDTYGGMVLVLKDQVKKDSTYILGDTFHVAQLHFGYEDPELKKKTDQILEQLLRYENGLTEETVASIKAAQNGDNELRQSIVKLLGSKRDLGYEQMRRDDLYAAISRQISQKEDQNSEYLLGSCLFQVCGDVEGNASKPVDYGHIENLAQTDRFEQQAMTKILSEGDVNAPFAYYEEYFEAQIHKPIDILKDVAEIRLSESELPENGADREIVKNEILEWGRRHKIKITIYTREDAEKKSDAYIMQKEGDEELLPESLQEIVGREYLRRYTADEGIKSVIRRTVASSAFQEATETEQVENLLKTAIEDEVENRNQAFAKFDEPLKTTLLAVLQKTGLAANALSHDVLTVLKDANDVVDKVTVNGVSRYEVLGILNEFIFEKLRGLNKEVLLQSLDLLGVLLECRAEGDTDIKTALARLAGSPEYKRLKLALNSLLPAFELGPNDNDLNFELSIAQTFQLLTDRIDDLVGARPEDSVVKSPELVTHRERAVFKELFPSLHRRIMEKYPPTPARKLNSLKNRPYPKTAPKGIKQTRLFLLQCLDDYHQHEIKFDHSDFHGRSHAIRVFIFAHVLSKIIKEKGGTVNENIVAMMGAGHDIGREKNGPDIFEEKSANITKDKIKKQYNDPDNQEQFDEMNDEIGAAIMSGDLGADNIESYLLHSADSLDFWRVNDLDLSYFPFLREDVEIGGKKISKDEELRNRLAQESMLLTYYTHPRARKAIDSRKYLEAGDMDNATVMYKEMAGKGTLEEMKKRCLETSNKQMLEDIEAVIRNHPEEFPLLRKYYLSELDGVDYSKVDGEINLGEIGKNENKNVKKVEEIKLDDKKEDVKDVKKANDIKAVGGKPVAEVGAKKKVDLSEWHILEDREVTETKKRLEEMKSKAEHILNNELKDTPNQQKQAIVGITFDDLWRLHKNGSSIDLKEFKKLKLEKITKGSGGVLNCTYKHPEKGAITVAVTEAGDRKIISYSGLFVL